MHEYLKDTDFRSFLIKSNKMKTSKVIEETMNFQYFSSICMYEKNTCDYFFSYSLT